MINRSCDFETIVANWEEHDVLLTESYALATSLNRARARKNDSGAFGVIAETFPSWMDKLWEQHGDGRRLVTRIQRLVIMQRLINQTHDDAGPLRKTSHLAKAAASCVLRGAGIVAFEKAVNDPASLVDRLSPAECEMLKLLAAYQRELRSQGLIELGDAFVRIAKILADEPHVLMHRPISEAVSSRVRESDLGGVNQEARSADESRKARKARKARVCFVGDAPLPVLWRECFSLMEASVELVHLRSDGSAFDAALSEVATVPNNVSLSFALPTGPYAQARIIDEIVTLVAADGPVVIAAKNPLKLFRGIERAAALRGRRVAVRAQKPFFQTDWGFLCRKIFNALQHEGSVDWCGACELVDVLTLPILDVDQSIARDIRRRVKNDRLIDARTLLPLLDEASETFLLLRQVIASADESALARIQRMLESSGDRGSAAYTETLNAFEGMRECLCAALEQGVSPNQVFEFVLPLLESIIVSLPCANFPTGLSEQPDVLIVSQRQAAQLSKGKCSTMIVTDLDSVSYPSAGRSNASETLLRNVGVEEVEQCIDQQRRTFAQLVNLPSKHLVLARCQNDSDAVELYPCAMLEEFLEVNEVDVSPEIVDDEIGFPKLFVSGEEDIVADVLGCTVEQNPVELESTPPASEDAGEPFDVTAKLTNPFVKADGTYSLSPSSLEAYHECPRKWFITRWLNVCEPGEFFGPRERGSFIHACIQAFYERFIAAGFEKVTSENLPEARELMKKIVHELRERQYAIAPDSSERRYVAVPGSMKEEREYQVIQDELCETWLEEESRFLAGTGFKPTLFEYQIDDLGVEVGGVMLRGRVDRIDMDDEGRIVIVDYKGAVGPEYEGRVREIVSAFKPDASGELAVGAEGERSDIEVMLGSRSGADGSAVADGSVMNERAEADDSAVGFQNGEVVQVVSNDATITSFAGRKIQIMLYAAALHETSRLNVPHNATAAQAARIEAFSKAAQSRIAQKSSGLCIGSNLLGRGDVVGAVYFSYNVKLPMGRKRSAGLYRSDVLAPSDLLLESSEDAGFQGYSFQDERALYDAIGDLLCSMKTAQLQGKLEPELHQKEKGDGRMAPSDVCSYCPDLQCAMRRR